MDDERRYWLYFSAFPGIGPLRFKLLRNYFDSAKTAWFASESELREIGMGEKLVERLSRFKKTFHMDNYLRRIREANVEIVTLEDPDYPAILKEIPDAPFVLYLRGKRELLPEIKNAVAVVGTRKITGYGRMVTEQLVRDLAIRQIPIISGMAYGVDTVAHTVAMSVGVKTVAVLGCGVDMIHPKSNTDLYWDIVKGKGLVLSEFPVGQYAEKGLFPARNRIISGLSLGVVVTEGARDSGALITARFALDQGREVFAVPGPVTSEMSEGPIGLLKQGAKLVTSAQDILEELKLPAYIRNQNAKAKNTIQNLKLSEEEMKIIDILGKENLHMDQLVRISGIPLQELGSLMTMLEMKGVVKNLGLGIYGCLPD